MTTVGIHEAKTHLSRLLRAVEEGEEVVILRGSRPVARLVAIQSDESVRKLGTAKGLVRVSEDFDEPLEDFGAYR
ncbi:MAG: type II toxin-antitoxin system Phd/YefM family antitoxin [Thermoanaerobaculales bacterium]|nr:type II toxin-antitoxin system Phd/YefM family antitoxin [Thermoanaerobaculales bacterium]